MAQQEQVRMVTFCLLQYVAGLVGFQSVVVLAPAFLKRDGFTHVLIYGNATEHIRTTQTNNFQSKKITAKSKHRFPNRA